MGVCHYSAKGERQACITTRFVYAVAEETEIPELSTASSRRINHRVINRQPLLPKTVGSALGQKRFSFELWKLET